MKLTREDRLKQIKIAEWKQIKIAEWNIADKCNYQCSYCSSGIIKKTSIRDYKKFINKMDKVLGGNWLIHLGGYGEPFIAPNFIDIIKELIKKNYYLGIITNFSSSVQTIFDFCDIVGENLLYFNASLHLEMVDLGNFLEKVRKVKKRIPFLVVSSVAQSGKLTQLIKIGRRIKKEKIKFVVQLQKSNEGYCNYTKKELREIEKNFGYVYGLRQNNNFQSRKCSAGTTYFVLNENGYAYTCYSYKKAYRNSNKRKEGYLGNILEDSFSLNKKNITCDLKLCSCSTIWRAKNWKK